MYNRLSFQLYLPVKEEIYLLGRYERIIIIIIVEYIYYKIYESLENVLIYFLRI